MGKSYRIFYKGKPFNNVFDHYCIGNKKWIFDSKEKAILTLKKAIKNAKEVWDTDFADLIGENFTDIADLNKFEIIEFGIIKQEKINL